jgi:hypothetical protein
MSNCCAMPPMYSPYVRNSSWSRKRAQISSRSRSGWSSAGEHQQQRPRRRAGTRPRMLESRTSTAGTLAIVADEPRHRLAAVGAASRSAGMRPLLRIGGVEQVVRRLDALPQLLVVDRRRRVPVHRAVAAVDRDVGMPVRRHVRVELLPAARATR